MGSHPNEAILKKIQTFVHPFDLWEISIDTGGDFTYSVDFALLCTDSFKKYVASTFRFQDKRAICSDLNLCTIALKETNILKGKDFWNVSIHAQFCSTVKISERQKEDNSAGSSQFCSNFQNFFVVFSRFKHFCSTFTKFGIYFKYLCQFFQILIRFLLFCCVRIIPSSCLPTLYCNVKCCYVGLFLCCLHAVI